VQAAERFRCNYHVKIMVYARDDAHEAWQWGLVLLWASALDWVW
jgi:hypothetical protein